MGGYARTITLAVLATALASAAAADIDKGAKVRELDALLSHLHSAVGRKQAQIVDHTVSTHIMMALSFAGKLREIPGIEGERARPYIEGFKNARG